MKKEGSGLKICLKTNSIYERLLIIVSNFSLLIDFKEVSDE